MKMYMTAAALALAMMTAATVPATAQGVKIPAHAKANKCGWNSSVCSYSRDAHTRAHYKTSSIYRCWPGEQHCAREGGYVFWYWR